MEWFGPVLTTIRFKRHIKTLWLNGLIYGLIAKKDCNKLLKNEPAGAFIVRFSDSVPGSFAVAYTDDSVPTVERVKHYLIKPEEINAMKALPDFLRDKPHFKSLVYVDVMTGKAIKGSKETLLNSFFSKRDSVTKPSTQGYVQQLDT